MRHQSAADVAKELQLYALEQRLRGLAQLVGDSPGKLRCAVCGDEVMKSSQLRRLSGLERG